MLDTLAGLCKQQVNRVMLSNRLSNDPIDRERMPVDAGGRLRQGQAPNAAGRQAQTWLRTKRPPAL